MINNKVNKAFLIISVFAFSCKKDVNNIPCSNFQNDKILANPKVEEAYEDLSGILPNNRLQSFDWKNVQVKQVDKSSFELTITNLRGNDTLTYLVVNQMKLYQMEGEVHLIKNSTQ